MPVTAPPIAPDRNDPATFSARADAFVAWLTAAVPEFNNLALATGPGTFLSGSAAAPSITFQGDTDTGICHPAANQIGFAIGGVIECLINSTGFSGDGSQITALNMANVGSGTLAIARGGTGATTASAARTALGLGSAAVAPLLDEDDFASNSATGVPSQQSAKAYIDTAIPAKLNASGLAPVFALRAWVNFNGTGTVAIRAAGNVSSITDNGTGDYTVNFTTAMPDANYAVVGTSMRAISDDGGSGGAAKTTSSVRVSTVDSSAARTDYANVSIAIVR